VLLLFRLVCEAEVEVTRSKLASVITEIAHITPLTPDGNRTQSWPIGMLPVICHYCFTIEQKFISSVCH